MIEKILGYAHSGLLFFKNLLLKIPINENLIFIIIAGIIGYWVSGKALTRVVVSIILTCLIFGLLKWIN